MSSRSRTNKPCKPFRAATVAGKLLMASPVTACNSGTRGETFSSWSTNPELNSKHGAMFRVEFWIRAISLQAL